MNKTALKNFATWSRRKLIEQVQTKALLYGIDEKNDLHIEEQFGQLLINGQTYPLSMKSAFTALQKQLEQKGYKQLLEEAAYTWFNRIIAIRYMEVHEYLPERVNVLSSSVGRVDPDILFEYDTMDLNIKQEEVRELVNAGNTEAAFRILFVAQCNALNRILPFMFEPIQDYTELLLPDFLLDAESVIKTLVKSEELTESFAEIEVIGWLYQYYNSEEKDSVINAKKRYTKEELPYATQLFTPKWIVRYMVQNSLGRLWLGYYPEQRKYFNDWEFYIEGATEIKPGKDITNRINIEEIKCIDPAMGSGHILLYMFDLLYEIYKENGYPEKNIPQLILENNLYGLEIDERAYQMANFTILMKACQYNKRFLRNLQSKTITMNLINIYETNSINKQELKLIAEEFGFSFDKITKFINQFKDAKAIGSLLKIEEFDEDFLNDVLIKIESSRENLFNFHLKDTLMGDLKQLIKQAKVMTAKYDVTVTNPPYAGNKYLPPELTFYLDKEYPNTKSDLFSAFIEYTFELTKENGQMGYLTPFVWMFISTYENLRDTIIQSKNISSLVQLEYNGFEAAMVPVCIFTLRNYKFDKNGEYIRLDSFKGIDNQHIKTLEAVKNPSLDYRYSFNQNQLNLIPGKPIAYWASDKVVNAFKNSDILSNVGFSKKGLDTGKNDLYLRYWFEVSKDKINKKWFPLNKGGAYRKWYGNQNYLIDWENNGEKLKSLKSSNIRNEKFYFKESIGWSDLTSGDFGARYYPDGFIFEATGPSFFCDNIMEILGYMNSNVFNYLAKFTMSTMHYTNGSVAKMPYKKLPINIQKIVEENVEISKDDWDSFENSMDFIVHPFLKYSHILLEDAYLEWEKYKEHQYNKLKVNEEFLNELFIELYDLKSELSPSVDENKIVIRKANRIRDSKAFLSYFIGILTGRYSLESFYQNESGVLIKFNLFKQKIKKLRLVRLTDKLYFDDDIILNLREFLSVVFSPNTVDENIQWLAESLEMKKGEDAETRLRRYFINEFYTEHCKMYQKRPIYWLVDSGKQKGLRTLIYMHHYQPDTMATIRFEHLQEIQAKYQQEIADLENRLVNPNLSATDKKKLNAEKVSFEKKIEELREFDKRLAEFATAALPIELDDGVKVNYEKFYRGGKGVLAKIK